MINKEWGQNKIMDENKNENKYIKRLVASEIEKMLKVTGAILIKGPKWCGKTTSAEQFAKSKLDLQDEDTKEKSMKIAENKISLLLEGENPRLIDEWQEIPRIWNMVKTDVSRQGKEGLYLLTGSTTPKDEVTERITFWLRSFFFY